MAWAGPTDKSMGGLQRIGLKTAGYNFGLAPAHQTNPAKKRDPFDPHIPSSRHSVFGARVAGACSTHLTLVQRTGVSDSASCRTIVSSWSAASAMVNPLVSITGTSNASAWPRRYAAHRS